nr:uncharacterized mitochondrial protein AtMg00810-like [Tanacetum cinerariifolium]
KAADDKPRDDTGSKTVEEPVNKEDQAYRYELAMLMSQKKEASDAADAFTKDAYDDDLDIFTSPVQSMGVEADFNNMESSTVVSPIPTHKVYVDDIVFGSTKKSLCDEFKALMHKRFQISYMGELTFFLGLQVKQSEEGIFISQDKSMIGSLMYLTASRPDIMFAACACFRFQVTPKISHLYAVKRIFRYLRG